MTGTNLIVEHQYQHLNHLAVWGAALAAAMLGALWYSPVLFAGPWMRELGLGQTSKRVRSLPLLVGGSILINLITAYLIDEFVGVFSMDPMLSALSFVILVGSVVGSIGMNYLFEERSIQLFGITAGYHLVRLALMGWILHQWGWIQGS